jgi:hypothetical protein
VAPVVLIPIPQAKALMAMILQSIPHLRLKAAVAAVVMDGQHFPTAKVSKAVVVVDLERLMPLQLPRRQPNPRLALLELIHQLQLMDKAVVAQFLMVEFKRVLAAAEQAKLAGLPLRVETMLLEKVVTVSLFRLQVHQSLMQVAVVVLLVLVVVQPGLQSELEELEEAGLVLALELEIQAPMA